MYIWGSLLSEINSQNLIKISGIERLCPPIFVEWRDIVPENENLFPTGNIIDKLILSENESIMATLLSGANPSIIITPEVLNLKGYELPKEINYELIREKLKLICQAAAKLMKIEVTEALKISWVSRPISYKEASGNQFDDNSVDIISRITANNRIHHEYTATGAINLAVACNIKGTLANLCLRDQERKYSEIRIGSPGGSMTCEANVEFNKEKGKWEIRRAGLVRSARILMDGWVYA